ncbi:hypothetical protein ACFE04_007169 [Oxalis oulophora]
MKKLTSRGQQGGKDFVVEIEMLSRLHHHNIVKLVVTIVVMTLHDTFFVMSLGLVYLHEDSQPCVIHGYFKASNILLENNFNAKVVDFYLAKQAPKGRENYFSTRGMDTFGYVAREYTITGHLLVKVMREIGDYIGMKVHACVGGTGVRKNQRILEVGVHVVMELMLFDIHKFYNLMIEEHFSNIPNLL